MPQHTPKGNTLHQGSSPKTVVSFLSLSEICGFVLAAIFVPRSLLCEKGLSENKKFKVEQ